MERESNRFHPAVDKRLLIVFSGAAWMIVGGLLCYLALIWLSQADFRQVILPGTGGIMLSLTIRFGFVKLVDHNINRILAMKDKVCIFAFQAWKSYLIILIMITLGVALRRSPLPKPFLSAIYIGFGGAMIFSSLRYFRVFQKLIHGTER